MKYLLLIVILFASCTTPNGKEKVTEDNNTKPRYDYRVVIIDKCEYIEVADGYYSLTHKGDCNNLIHPERIEK